MHVELVTKEDIKTLKDELLMEMKNLISKPLEQKEWLKSHDVMKLLNCSPGTLQNLRINGNLPFTKMGGTIYYAYSDVLRVLNGNKQNAA